MIVTLEIETHDRQLGFDIAGINGTLSAGATVDVPGGAKIAFQGALMRKSFGIPEVLQFLLDASTEVEIALFAAWLYDKVKEKPVDRIRIQRTVITHITRDSILQVLKEEMKSED